MLIIGSAPVNFFYFIFLLKTKESASLAWLFLHTGRWPACIELVFYWICGSRIFSLETLLTSLGSHCTPGYSSSDRLAWDKNVCKAFVYDPAGGADGHWHYCRYNTM